MAQRRRLGAWLVGLLVLAGVVGLAVQVWPLIWAMPERLHPPLAEAQLKLLFLSRVDAAEFVACRLGERAHRHDLAVSLLA